MAADSDEGPEADEIPEAELALAAAGEWEALGLDPPEKGGPDFQSASIDDFLAPDP